MYTIYRQICKQPVACAASGRQAERPLTYLPIYSIYICTRLAANRHSGFSPLSLTLTGPLRSFSHTDIASIRQLSEIYVTEKKDRFYEQSSVIQISKSWEGAIIIGATTSAFGRRS